jgi:phosphoribosylglycinamide formyltransferase 1
MIRLGILGSTRGTHLQTIVEAIQQKRLAASVEIVMSNRPDAFILKRAAQYHLRGQYMDPTAQSREDYDQTLSTVFRSYQVDFVVLVGYMRLLSAPFVTTWNRRVINVHPSLLPAFAGKVDLEVHRAVLASSVKKTGCTVHYVTIAVDAGPILLQKDCTVLANDTVERLKARVQQLEGEALVTVLSRLATTEV